MLNPSHNQFDYVHCRYNAVCFFDLQTSVSKDCWYTQIRAEREISAQSGVIILQEVSFEGRFN